jgi:hypothetical protein
MASCAFNNTMAGSSTPGGCNLDADCSADVFSYSLEYVDEDTGS